MIVRLDRARSAVHCRVGRLRIRIGYAIRKFMFKRALHVTYKGPLYGLPVRLEQYNSGIFPVLEYPLQYIFSAKG
jgi:hypothetical protein